MKRKWIFFVLLVVLSVIAPNAQATPVDASEIATISSASETADFSDASEIATIFDALEIAFETPPGCWPWFKVRRILVKCVQETNFSFGQLVQKYFHNRLLIERVDSDTVKVTILLADGGTIIAILDDSF